MWLYLEFIKRMSIKRAFFLLTVICLLIGGSLGCIGFWGLGLLNQERDISIKMENDTFTYEYQQENTHDLERNSSGIITFLQVVFLVFCIICSIIVADIIFYYKKIKKPVENLLVGANKINNSDLNFSIKSESSDELGKLCIVFEKMRITMQKTIESLWKVAEERKRLNAAFSHDLRNSLTILKGEIAVIQKGISSGLMNDEEILEVFSGVGKNIKRLEKHIAIMSSITDLEAVPCSPQVVNIQTFKRNLESHVQLLVKDTTIKIIFDVEISEKEILFLDQDIFYNIIDNIILNALRYAKTQICLKIRIEEDFLHMSIQDDGVGFSDYIIKKGREAFIRDGEKNGDHFGMGLYICRLFCEKHGGAFYISNNDMGALYEVFINIKEFE